jgi:tetratricopeptide (TPR) repeat protein
VVTRQYELAFLRFARFAARMPWSQSYATHMARRYQRTGDPVHLRYAIESLRFSESVTGGRRDWLSRHARTLCLTNLAVLLPMLAQVEEKRDLLREAVAAGREAVVLSESHYRSQRSLALGNLAMALFEEFRLTGDVATGRESEAIAAAALRAAGHWPGRRSRCLNNLATARMALAERTGDGGELLRGAIEALREGVRTSRLFRARRTFFIGNLSYALYLFHEVTGDVKALHESVNLGRKAVARTSDRHYFRGARLSNLALAQLALAQHAGDPELRSAAVGRLREGIAAAQLGPGAVQLSVNLSFALEGMSSSDTQLLPLSVAAARVALDMSVPGSLDSALAASRLGSALDNLFQVTRELSTLREAVTHLRTAVEATGADHPRRVDYLSALASALDDWSSAASEPAARAESIARYREAVAVAETFPARKDYAVSLVNLAEELYYQFILAGEGIDVLREAISLCRRAIGAIADDDPYLAFARQGLGQYLLSLYAREIDAATLSEARDMLERATAESRSRIFTQMWARRSLAQACGWSGDAEDAVKAIGGAVSLLPKAAPRTLRTADRRHQLNAVGQLAADAAAYALEAGEPGTALEFLERGRGLLMGEAMGARGEAGRLRRLAPGLAREFERLRDMLSDENANGSRMLALATPGSGRDPVAPDLDRAQLAGPWDGDQLRDAGQAWEPLLARIRQRPGLGDFLLPPAAGELRRVPGEAVVFVTASYLRCDALLLVDDPDQPVRHVPLAGLDWTSVNDAATACNAAVRRAMQARSLAGNTEGNAEVSRILGWLWDEVAGPVLDRLGYAGTLGPDGNLPRLWWCPVGPFVDLPLHAAGHHGEVPPQGTAPRTVLDRVVSSYTATARILDYARQAPPGPAATGSAGPLIVAMPVTPGEGDLDGVAGELGELRRLMPQSTLLTGAGATARSVLAALPSHPVAHFACHAVSGTLRDLEAGRLVVSGDGEEPVTVGAISRADIPDGELAYLSACRTAASTPSDEALHVTTAFQLAGYRSVIGTLWEVPDRTARKVAVEVYAELTGDGRHSPVAAHSARALHDAVRRLRRDAPDLPVRWAGHVHVGI